MSVQISTRVDETTKKQFDKICEVIGISPSNALSMFIRGVINNNGFPFSPVVPPAKTSVNSREFVPKTAVRPPFEYGSMSEKMWMADDFNEPLDDFKEYME